MLFQATITIPKNTTYTEPLKQTLKIARGIISKFMVRPRPGHAGLAHLTISYHQHQIAPSTENMDLHGDAAPIDWEDYYECYTPPYELILKGWNDDDTYEHSFDVFIAVLPRKAVISTAITDIFTDVMSKIAALFGVFFPKPVDIEES